MVAKYNFLFKLPSPCTLISLDPAASFLNFDVVFFLKTSSTKIVSNLSVFVNATVDIRNLWSSEML